jgi:predicted nucleic acid-binding protein
MPIGPALDETSLVIDTMVLTYWRHGRPNIRESIRDYLSRLKRPPALASVTVFEALWGFEKEMLTSKSNNERTKNGRIRTDQLIEQCAVLALDEAAARIAAYAFARLSSRDRNRLWRDVLIAATALSHGHGLATENRADFTLIAANLPPSHQLLRLAIWKH